MIIIQLLYLTIIFLSFTQYLCLFLQGSVCGIVAPAPGTRSTVCPAAAAFPGVSTWQMKIKLLRYGLEIIQANRSFPQNALDGIEGRHQRATRDGL